MTTPLSMDLRVRALTAVAGGLSHRQAEARFGVSAASISRWRALEREHGDARPRPMGGDKRSQLIEAHGASLLFLPRYSPDFNPIENAFAKLKAGLRKAAERTIAALWQGSARSPSATTATLQGAPPR